MSAKNTDIRLVDVRCYYLLTMPAPWGLLMRNPPLWRWVKGSKVSASWRSRLNQLCYECDFYETDRHLLSMPQAAFFV